MVETIECIGYFINVCTNLVRCFFFECIFNRISESGKLQHQIFLACIYCRKDFTCIQIAAFFFVTVQNRFDTHDRIENIRTGISLKRSKPVNIKYVILCSLIGICVGTKYLLCDETFDGLDPVVRQGVKSLFAAEIMSREFSPVLASHNLRELEDICDHVGLLYKGGMLLSRNLEDMKFHIHKIQCVFTDKKQEDALKKELDVLKVDHQGSLVMITARGTRAEIMAKIQEKNPLFCEVLPLTLEEIFISETEVAGYEIQNIFF